MKLKPETKEPGTALITLPDGNKTKEGPIALEIKSEDLLEAAAGTITTEPVDAEFTPVEPPVSDAELVANEVVQATEQPELTAAQKIVAAAKACLTPKTSTERNLGPLFEGGQGPDVEIVDWQMNVKEDIQKIFNKAKEDLNKLRLRAIAVGNDVNGHIANLRDPKWRLKQAFLYAEWQRDTLAKTAKAWSNLGNNLFSDHSLEHLNHEALELVFDNLHERVEEAEKKVSEERLIANARIFALEKAVHKLTRTLNRKEGEAAQVEAEDLDKLLDMITKGHKTAACGMYRKLTGADMAEAKLAIERTAPN